MFIRFESFPALDSMTAPGDLFGRFLNTGWGFARVPVPALDVVEDSNELVVVAELPGVKKADLHVKLHDGVLTISGERKQQEVPEESGWRRVETESGAFSRSLELPVAVNASGITAELKAGILRIVIPKADESRPRDIRVN